MKHLIILVIGGLMFFSCAGHRPEKLGVKDGHLRDCPSKPNCVSSQAIDKDQIVLPFSYTDEKEIAFNRMKKIIASFDRATIVAQNDNYLHIEFKSKIIGFVDDVEFYFSHDNVIHVKSASRLGYSDFGVNRKRVEQLRMLFAKE
jgi:uncharacterized protein (DUF1499 family)